MYTVCKILDICVVGRVVIEISSQYDVKNRLLSKDSVFNMQNRLDFLL